MQSTFRIVLVRHGRSAHVHRGLVDLAGVHRWRASYEAAGIDPRDEPPSAIRALATASGVIVASTAPRAVESARVLDPSRDAVTTDLLSELGLVPPNLRGVRLPLLAWALAIGITHRVAAAELQRSRDAAEWLADLAERHGSVLAVTHHSFRRVLGERLIERGWLCETAKRRMSHWSAWVYSITAAASPRT